MNYFILNINYDKKSEVDQWLGKRKLAPIFYGKCTLEQIRHGLKPKQYGDASNFVKKFDCPSDDNLIFSIGNEYVYIYKQDGQLKEFPEYKTPHDDLVKGFRIKDVQKEKIKDCPLILASIKSNIHFAAGTFKSISGSKYSGDIKALDYLIGYKNKKGKVKVSSFVEYLQCLSSLEFETLIAKYLEESGLFVPAYKGGFIRNYDLFCRNITDKAINVDKIIVEPKERISVQIKLHLKKAAYNNKIIDHFFCITSDIEGDNIYDHKYLQRNLEKTPITKKWLENSLDWAVY